MSTIQEKIEDHEKRLKKMEVDSARLDERILNLVESTNHLKWGMWAFSFMMLLAIIWTAIGKEGFKDVTSTALPFAKSIEVSK